MPEPEAALDRSTLMLASIAGMGAIIALPMFEVAPGSRGVMIFFVPLLLAVIGRGTGRTWLVALALGLLVLLGSLFLFPTSTALNLLAFVVVLIGPVLAVILVGAPLRRHDVVAAAGFLGAGTIAIIGGFAAAQLDGAVALVVGVALLGVAVVLFRLGRATTADT